jgi:sulfur carrier protein
LELAEKERHFMIIVVNAERLEVDERTTVATLLQSLGYPDRGIAVALDQTVLPRSCWATKLSALAASSRPVRLEVVTAVQGG